MTTELSVLALSTFQGEAEIVKLSVTEPLAGSWVLSRLKEDGEAV
jgi:hypothetical protein